MKGRIQHLTIAPRIPVVKSLGLMVYALYRHEVMVYVGITANLEARIIQHLASSKDFDSYSMIEAGSQEEMHELEFRCIVEYVPEYNLGLAGTVKSGFSSIESLKKRYLLGAREIRKAATKAGVEVLYFNGSGYYYTTAMDAAMGVKS